MLFQAYHYLSCVAGAKRGGERKAQKKILLSFSLPPNPLPLTKPATQGNPCLLLVNYSTVQLFDCRVGKRLGGGGGAGGELLPYISYIGICRPIGWGFCAVLV